MAGSTYPRTVLSNTNFFGIYFGKSPWPPLYLSLVQRFHFSSFEISQILQPLSSTRITFTLCFHTIQIILPNSQNIFPTWIFHLQMDPPSLLSFLLAIFYIFFFPRSSVSQEDTSFGECAPLPFNCGNVVNVTYPFLAGNRSHICGYQNLTLLCVNNSTEIEIQSQKYQIKRIDYPNRLLTVVLKDAVENDCPRPSRNTSLGNYLVEYTDKDEKLTLLYDCDPLLSSNSDFHEISCLKGVNSDVSSYFWIGSVVDLPSSPNNSTSWSNCCGSVVQVSLLGSGLDRLKWNASSYGKEMQEGFEVRWIMGAGWCTLCVESGGICGVNTAVPEESTCFCHDKPSFATCGAPPSGKDKNDDNTRRNIKIVIGVSAGAGSFILAWFFFYLLQWFRRKRCLQKASSVLLSRNVSSDPSSKNDLENYSSTNYATQLFSYRELQEATNNFDSSNEVGDGGFGTVYYGKLRDGRSVAVKRLYENNYKRVEQFMNEIKILSCLRHRNLVSLYGCNARHSRELLLVYEFIPNGTVADHLHGDLMKNGALTWPVRMNIAIETAEALAYLHAVEPQIIHRDVKTNNILLDINFSVKVADFGLSRLFPTDVTHVSTTPQGTPGYVDPDYHKCYQLTDKSDVYSFGVVLMELVSSKPAVDITRHRHEVNLSTMAINKIHNQALHELVDLSLGFESDSRVSRMMTSVAELAFQCLQEEKEMRPSMEEVLKILKGIDSAVHDVEKKQMRDAGNPVDTIGLLVNNSLHSPDSVINTWDSKSSTPYTSG